MPKYTKGSTSVGTFATDITPVSADGSAIGTIALPWSDVRLASGAVIDVGNGEITITFAADSATLAGGGLSMPAGSASANSLYWASDTGFWFAGGVLDFKGVLNFYLTNGTTLKATYNTSDTGNWDFVSGVLLRWNSQGSIFGPESDAVFQMGVDSATPITQALKGPDARAGTDTDTVGGRINWRTGLSTGNAVPAIQSLQGGAATVTSGTGAQTVVDRFIPNAFKVLTDGSAIAVLNVTVANNTMTGGKIVYCIEATDGTDYQSEIGEVFYATQNDGAAVVGAIAEANTQQAISAGGSTLTSTWAMTDANPAVISVNANTSLTPSTGFPRITFSVQNLGQQAVAIQ